MNLCVRDIGVFIIQLLCHGRADIKTQCMRNIIYIYTLLYCNA